MTLSFLLSTPDVIVHQVNVTGDGSTFTYRQCCFVLCNTMYRCPTRAQKCVCLFEIVIFAP